jgi:hypothetical protein
MTTVIQQLARLIEQAKHSEPNVPWYDPAAEKVRDFVHEYLPSGSGLDGGINIEFDRCKADRIVIEVEFHHMNEFGMYTGWTNHNIIVKPAFYQLDIRVTGPNKNEIKEYLADLFFHALTQEYIHGNT